MSGPFEKYVEPAAEASWNSKLPTYWLDEAKQTWSEVPEWKDADENDKQYARETTLAALATVGPLIQEDTRERMVAAAGAALEREGGAAGGCEQAYERGRREVLKEIANEMALSHPGDPRVRYVEVQIDLDTYRQIMAAREVATEGAS